MIDSRDSPTRQNHGITSLNQQTHTTVLLVSLTNAETDAYRRSNKFIVFVFVNKHECLRLCFALALLARRWLDTFALRVYDIVFVLDEPLRLLLFELLHRFGKSRVQDLAAVRRTSGSIERVHDTRIWRAGWRAMVGARAARVFRECLVRGGFEHVVLASDLGAVS